jgi:coproporphyrinogen III oxidase-like Fe-S oxidoreductase
MKRKRPKIKRKPSNKQHPKKKISWERFDMAMRKIMKAGYTMVGLFVFLAELSNRRFYWFV